MAVFLQQLIDGITLGTIQEPIAIGYLPLLERSARMTI